MAIPRAPKGLRWVLKQAATYHIGIALLASGIGFSAAANYAAQGKAVLAALVTGATIGVLLFSVVKQVIGLADAAKTESVHELEGCLHTLHAVLAPAPDCVLRLAVHVPVGEELEQVTEYIGVPAKAGRVGRRFPANAGVIGKAYRENDHLVARRANDDYEAYVSELIRDWNYTPERARLLNPGVMEWMAVPFYDPDRRRVEAVLYLDVNRRDFLTTERQELVLAAANGIAVFYRQAVQLNAEGEMSWPNRASMQPRPPAPRPLAGSIAGPSSLRQPV